MILYNGQIFSNDEFYEAIVFQDGIIKYIGTNEDAMKVAARPGEEKINLSGRLVLPGFIDSHAHGGAFTAMKAGKIDLSEADSAEAYYAVIRKYVEENPDVECYKGLGWQSPIFNGEPHKEPLDAICRDKPIVIKSAEGHAIWVNSKVIEMAGVTESTPSPKGGAIFKNEDGSLKGSFADEALSLVEKNVPDDTVGFYKEIIMQYQEKMLPYGYTATTELMMDKDSNLHKAFMELAEEEKLLIKTEVTYLVSPRNTAETLEKLKDRKPSIKNKLIDGYYAKVVIDGVIENATAALKEPYSNNPGFSGELLWEDEQLFRTCIELDKMGYDIHFHVIGDKAVEQMTNAVEAVIKANGSRKRRPVAAHVQLADRKDLERFAELGISLSANPYWFFKDEVYTVENEIPLLGERAEQQFPMKTLLDLGVVISCGSDYSITAEPYPLYAMKFGMERVDLLADKDDKSTMLNPQERIDFRSMLDCITINGAYTMNIEELTGSLEIGKMADMVVLDRNLFEAPTSEYKDIRVDMTISEGEIVYHRNI